MKFYLYLFKDGLLPPLHTLLKWIWSLCLYLFKVVLLPPLYCKPPWSSTSFFQGFPLVQRRCSSQKGKNNTKDSYMVPHHSTNLTRLCLTSLSRREAVLSWLYGHSWLIYPPCCTCMLQTYKWAENISHCQYTSHFFLRKAIRFEFAEHRLALMCTFYYMHYPLGRYKSPSVSLFILLCLFFLFIWFIHGVLVSKSIIVQFVDAQSIEHNECLFPYASSQPNPQLIWVSLECPSKWGLEIPTLFIVSSFILKVGSFQ